MAGRSEADLSVNDTFGGQKIVVQTLGQERSQHHLAKAGFPGARKVTGVSGAGPCSCRVGDVFPLCYCPVPYICSLYAAAVLPRCYLPVPFVVPLCRRGVANQYVLCSVGAAGAYWGRRGV
eukprot:gene13659-biopygen8043